MNIIQAVRATYTSWSPEGVREALEGAEKVLAQHGSIDKARAAISDLAYGNVSLTCRARFRPIDNVLSVMQRTAISSLDPDMYVVRSCERHARKEVRRGDWYHNYHMAVQGLSAEDAEEIWYARQHNREPEFA